MSRCSGNEEPHMGDEAFPHDVFLSHSAKDKAVVRPLAERLRQGGLKGGFGERGCPSPPGAGAGGGGGGGAPRGGGGGGGRVGGGWGSWGKGRQHRGEDRGGVGALRGLGLC